MQSGTQRSTRGLYFPSRRTRSAEGGASSTPPPGPLPEAERGRKTAAAPCFGEGEQGHAFPLLLPLSEAGRGPGGGVVLLPLSASGRGLGGGVLQTAGGIDGIARY